ncbi:FliM/FliN family flagellar motor switch protein [Brucella anthropi]|uniref:FliM/FliN family flagellar motor switch protein n=1 Tax=Brucella anthropi TaxID=529 RepID=UPI00384B1194
MIADYRLRQMDGNIANAINLLLSFEWTIIDSTCSATSSEVGKLSFGRSANCAEEYTLIEIRGALLEVVLKLDPALIDRLSDSELPEWQYECPDKLPFEWRALVCIGKVINLISKEHQIDDIQVRRQLVSDHFRLPGTTLFGAAIVGNNCYSIALHIIALSSKFVPNYANIKIRPITRMNDVKLLFYVILPSRTITLQSYSHLDTNDILILMPIIDNEIMFQAEIPGVARYTIKYSLSGRARVEAIDLLKNEELDLGRKVNQQAIELGEPFVAKWLPESGLGAAEIKLDFQLQPFHIKLDELGEIGIGSIIHSNIDLNAPIRVLVNGILVGSGHLIQLDEHLGIQLVHWPER